MLLNGARPRLRGMASADWLGNLGRVATTKQILLSHGFLDTIDLQLITAVSHQYNATIEYRQNSTACHILYKNV